MSDTKLHTAVRYGNEEETLQALKEGFDPNEIGMLRWSSVHEASHNGERDILKMLLLFKGDVNQKDGLHGNTPLHYAAQEDNSACVSVLLNAGAKLDIKNDQGRTPLEVATSSCLERMEPFVNNSQNRTGEDWPPAGSTTEGPKDRTNWQGLDDVPSNAAIGSLHLSFEFHKKSLKVRVWQITDLLLPPPQTSMIESIFVRGYLIPDAAKKTQRRTEDVLVDPNPKKDTSRRSSIPQIAGIQHIFTPSSFRFDNPLLYNGVTDDIVSQRSIQLEVCMTQKHTRKPFLMAMLHMPLRTAVRRPIREKYPLIPCMNYTIPNSMRVYSAKDIFVEGTSHMAGLDRSDSLQSNPDSTQSSSSTDTSHTLQDIYVDNSCVPPKSHGRKLISVNIPDSFDEDDDDDGGGGGGGGVGNDKENDGDGEDIIIDEDVESSLDVKICSGKGSVSPSVTVDVFEGSGSFNDESQSNSNSEEMLDDVVVDRPGCIGWDTIVVVGNTDQSEHLGDGDTKKKRIIPIELSVQSSDDDDDDNQCTVVVMEEPVTETVVDMTNLGPDTVLDMDQITDNGDLMTDSGYDNESIQSENSPMSENKQLLSSNKRRKRIIPTESNHSVKTEDDKEKDDTRVSEMIGAGEAEDDDEISKEIINSTRLQSESSQSQLSVDSPRDKNSTSRPETPVWDFYDFACPNDGTNNGEGGESSSPNHTNGSGHHPKSPSSDSEQTSSSSAPNPSAANTGTLQESLARLSRPQPVLDTCHVSGPVLPSITMMEDFEMDEES